MLADDEADQDEAGRVAKDSTTIPTKYTHGQRVPRAVLTDVVKKDSEIGDAVLSLKPSVQCQQERFRAKWKPVRVRKTRQIKE
jgi:hypothetical protein